MPPKVPGLDLSGDAGKDVGHFAPHKWGEEAADGYESEDSTLTDLDTDRGSLRSSGGLSGFSSPPLTDRMTPRGTPVGDPDPPRPKSKFHQWADQDADELGLGIEDLARPLTSRSEATKTDVSSPPLTNRSDRATNPAWEAQKKELHQKLQEMKNRGDSLARVCRDLEEEIQTLEADKAKMDKAYVLLEQNLQKALAMQTGATETAHDSKMVEKLERTIRSLDQQNRKLLAAAEERGDGNEAALRQQVQMLNRQLAEATQSGGSVGDANKQKSESTIMEQLADENRALKKELQKLKNPEPPDVSVNSAKMVSSRTDEPKEDASVIAKLERTIRSLDQENMKLRMGQPEVPVPRTTQPSKPLSAQRYVQLEEQVAFLQQELKGLKEEKRTAQTANAAEHIFKLEEQVQTLKRQLAQKNAIPDCRPAEFSDPSMRAIGGQADAVTLDGADQAVVSKMQRTILSLDQENKKLKEKLNLGNVGASDSRPGSARVHTELQASQPGQQSSYQDSDKSHRVILRLESQVAQLTQELTLAQSGSTGASSPARVMAASPTAGDSERLESQRMISQLKQQVAELQQQLAQQVDESRGQSKESTLKEAYNRGYKESYSHQVEGKHEGRVSHSGEATTSTARQEQLASYESKIRELENTVRDKNKECLSLKQDCMSLSSNASSSHSKQKIAQLEEQVASLTLKLNHQSDHAPDLKAQSSIHVQYDPQYVSQLEAQVADLQAEIAQHKAQLKHDVNVLFKAKADDKLHLTLDAQRNPSPSRRPKLSLVAPPKAVPTKQLPKDDVTATYRRAYEDLPNRQPIGGWYK